MLGQLTREHQSDGCLDFARRQGLLLVVSDETNGLLSDTVKHVINERVHDTHGLLGDARVWVHLLQHLENINVEMLGSLATLLRSLQNEVHADGKCYKMHTSPPIGVFPVVFLPAFGCFSPFEDIDYRKLVKELFQSFHMQVELEKKLLFKK